MKFMVSAAIAAAVSSMASATFTGYTVTTTAAGSLNVYQVFGNFNGATDTVLNAFQIHNTDGSGLITGFHHNDAITGGVDSTVAGTWNPQFTVSPVAADSFVCIGGSTGFSSGNSTNGDPGFGTAGFNQVNMPDTAAVGVAGWFNSNPPNLQGRVGPAGTMLLGQFALSNTAFMTLFMKVGYNSGIAGAPVQFGEGTFNLGVPAPGAIALLGLAGLTGRRRR